MLALMIAGTEPADNLYGKDFHQNAVQDLNLTESLSGSEEKKDVYIPLWGTDLNVREGYWSLIDMAVDVDDNDNIYVAILVNHAQPAENDTIEVWRSPDGGLSWEHIYSLYEPGIDGGMEEIDMVVGGGSNPYIYTFIKYDNAGADADEGIWMNRRRGDGTGNLWKRITSDSTDEKLTASINSSEYLMIGYRENGEDIFIQYSSDSGETWSSDYVSTGIRDWPSVWITDDTVGLIAYTVDDTVIRVGKYYDNFNNFDFYNIYPNAANLVNTSISGDNSGNYIVVWSNYHSSTDVWDVHYAYTTDAGANWQTGPFPPMNFPYGSRDALYPYVKYSGSYRFVVTLTGSFDSLYYAYSSSVDGWNQSTVVNDYNATTMFGARVDRTTYTSGGFVVYREYGSGNVWIDGFNYTGNQEISPTEKLVISVEGRVLRIINNSGKALQVKVFSTSGRVIATIHVGSTGFMELPSAGIYRIQFLGEGINTGRTIVAY